MERDILRDLVKQGSEVNGNTMSYIRDSWSEYLCYDPYTLYRISTMCDVAELDLHNQAVLRVDATSGKEDIVLTTSDFCHDHLGVDFVERVCPQANEAPTWFIIDLTSVPLPDDA